LFGVPSGPGGDELVKVAVGEHNTGAELPATDMDVAQGAVVHQGPQGPGGNAKLLGGLSWGLKTDHFTPLLRRSRHNRRATTD
jgi:hypothetical protein